MKEIVCERHVLVGRSSAPERLYLFKVNKGLMNFKHFSKVADLVFSVLQKPFVLQKVSSLRIL